MPEMIVDLLVLQTLLSYVLVFNLSYSVLFLQKKVQIIVMLIT